MNAINALIPLQMPSHHQEWLVLPSWRVLHRIMEILPDDIEDGLPNGYGVALCGVQGHFIVPGILSRMSLPRCANCCRLLGIPRGDGNTFNSNIKEDVVKRRWFYYNDLK